MRIPACTGQEGDSVHAGIHTPPVNRNITFPQPPLRTVITKRCCSFAILVIVRVKSHVATSLFPIASCKPCYSKYMCKYIMELFGGMML